MSWESWYKIMVELTMLDHGDTVQITLIKFSFGSIIKVNGGTKRVVMDLSTLETTDLVDWKGTHCNLLPELQANHILIKLK